MTRAPLCIAALLLSACGYQVLRGDRLFNADAVTLLPFAENAPLGLSPDLTLALGRELGAQGVTLSRDTDAGNAVLTGAVVATSTATSPTAGVGAPVPAYDIQVHIQAWLIDKNGKEVWRTDMSLSEGFLPSVDATDAMLIETEANRRRALLRLADVAARTIVERLTMASAAKEGA